MSVRRSMLMDVPWDRLIGFEGRQLPSAASSRLAPAVLRAERRAGLMRWEGRRAMDICPSIKVHRRSQKPLSRQLPGAVQAPRGGSWGETQCDSRGVRGLRRAARRAWNRDIGCGVERRLKREAYWPVRCASSQDCREAFARWTAGSARSGRLGPLLPCDRIASRTPGYKRAARAVSRARDRHCRE